jgi:DNA-binding Xre family transcriptional regulator
MIKIKIAELAAKRANVTSAYQLQNFLGISPSIASRLWKGDFDKIGINTINKLCYRLDCQPSDFLEYVRLPQSKEDPFHDGYVTKKQRAEGVKGVTKALGWGNPRNKKAQGEPQTDNILLNNSLFDNAQSDNTESDITQTKHVPQLDNTEISKTQSASDDDVWLSTNEVAERLKLSRKSVNDYILDGKLPATKGGDIPNHKGNSTHNFIKLDDVLIYESVYLSKD